MRVLYYFFVYREQFTMVLTSRCYDYLIGRIFVKIAR